MGVRTAFRLSGVIAIGLVAVAPAPASIVSGTILSGAPGGTFVELDPTAGGFSVGNNDFNQPNLFGFDEKQNFVLTKALAAEIGVTSIAIGTIVSSHFIFFDPLRQTNVTGSITFDAPILSVITTQRDLIASNYLGAPQVTYRDPALVGLERDDIVTINALFDTNLKFVAASTGDHMRVITLGAAPPVPEPATWAMMVGGFGFIGGALRRFPRRPATAA